MARAGRNQFNHNSRRTRKRRGVHTIELIMVLFVLVLATFVTVQFGTALIVKQTVAEASTVAAREAAKGATLDELTCYIDRVLGIHGIMIGANASYTLERNGIEEPLQGSLPCDPPATPMIDPDEVRVTLCVSLTTHPILNILQPYGVDYTGKKFMISSVATLE